MDADTQEVGQPEAAQEVNPIVEKAMQMGWRPQEEWNGSPEDWVDAKEYVGRQKLYDRIQDSNKRIKQMEKTLNEFKEHHQKVKETEYQRALDTLKAQKIRVLQEGDAEQLVDIEDKIDMVKEQIREVKQAPKQPEVDPDFQRVMTEWVDRNQWYQNDTALKKEADLIGYTYVQLNGPGDGPEDVLKAVEKEIRTRHPEKFMNQRKGEPPKVETGGTKNQTKGSGNDVVLSDEESQAMKKFVRAGLMTEKEYKEEIKRMRGNA